jgi:hypothetical protein
LPQRSSLPVLLPKALAAAPPSTAEAIGWPAASAAPEALPAVPVAAEASNVGGLPDSGASSVVEPARAVPDGEQAEVVAPAVAPDVALTQGWSNVVLGVAGMLMLISWTGHYLWTRNARSGARGIDFWEE